MNTNSKLIDAFSRLQTEPAMSCIVSAVKAKNFGADDLCGLAQAMGRSGAMIDVSRDHPTADLASTGGPGSLSTLLAPLYLRAYGLFVPKLGVPGRPAGGIDVLAQIPGYRIRLSAPEVLEILSKCGYAHFLADDVFAPLDAAFFRYRQKVGAQDVPALAIASLLAKKIACGVKFAGLDVRVAPHGNFGATYDEARQAARTFCDAARGAGIEAVASLTDARTPYQPYIGRGEALLALRMVMDRRADPWLAEHDDRCRLMAAQTASMSPGSRLSQGFDIGKVFVEHLEAQGSSKEAFYEKTNLVAAAVNRELSAERDGFLRVDVPTLRSVFVTVNSRGATADGFPDELGVILRQRSGAYVRRGDLMASVRANDAIWHEFAAALTECFQVVDLLNYAPGLEEVIRA
jgi:thymidine phosphorylase